MNSQNGFMNIKDVMSSFPANVPSIYLGTSTNYANNKKGNIKQFTFEAMRH